MAKPSNKLTLVHAPLGSFSLWSDVDGNEFVDLGSTHLATQIPEVLLVYFLDGQS